MRMNTFKLELGSTRLVVADPRAAAPYYRGTRFDRTGIILSLEAGGHRFVQPWQRHYDPFSHDAVSGPAEEFLPLFPDAGIVKIGVGLLRDDGEPYDRFKLYDILDPGRMTVMLEQPGQGRSADAVGEAFPERDISGFRNSAADGPCSKAVFRHTLPGCHDYEKTVEIPAEGRLCLTHTLRNDGSAPLDTYVYCHNFFILDGAPTGRATRFEFPFRPVGDWRAPYDSVRLTDRGIAFDRDLAPTETVFMGNLRPASDETDAPLSFLLPNKAVGSTNPAQNDLPAAIPGSSMHTDKEAGYRFTLRNLDNGLRIEAACDRPMEYAVFWSNSDVSCLEPYLPIHLDPGQTARWALDYHFLSGA